MALKLVLILSDVEGRTPSIQPFFRRTNHAAAWRSDHRHLLPPLFLVPAGDGRGEIGGGPERLARAAPQAVDELAATTPDGLVVDVERADPPGAPTADPA